MNTKILKEFREKKDISLTSAGEMIGKRKQSYFRKEKNGIFSAEELYMLKEKMNMPDEVYFKILEESERG